MKQAMKTAAPYGNVLSVETLLMALDERFHFAFTRTELAIAGVFISAALHFTIRVLIPAVWKYTRPIARALYRRLLAAVGAAVIVLFAFPAIADDGTPLRIVVECAKADLVLSEATNEITDECARPRIYFDIGVQFGGVAFNLDRPRAVLAGFNAGTGYGFRWLPDFWKLSDAFFSIDLFINAGFAAREDAGDVLALGFTAVFSFMNIVGGGFGYQWEIGFGDAPDDSTPIGVLGVVHSF